MLDWSIQICHIDWMDCAPIIITNSGVGDNCFTISNGVSFLNGLALLVMALGVVVGAMWENSFAVVG